MEDRLTEVERQIQLREQTHRELEKLINYVRFFLGGALALGIWVGTIQFTLVQHDKDLVATRVEVRSNEARIRATEQVQAANAATIFAKLDSIKETLSEIQKRQEKP